MNRVLLPGCAPIPLAHYLKALGVLRLVSEQADPRAAGCWHRDVFVLHSRLDRQGLLDFFLHHYAPTPILAPWNGGSGFYPGDNSVALQAIEESQCPRLASYQKAIAAARRALKEFALEEKPRADVKEQLLYACRNLFPESALRWLDAAFVLTWEGVKYPPLLGTGGNDGRLEFTNNFMQRIVEILDPQTGLPRAGVETWLDAALYDGVQSFQVPPAPVGQFYPGAAGGPNTTSGFTREGNVNPWDYVLMLEGALLFAAAAVKKLETGQPGTAAFPFYVQQTAAGYGTASATDELSPGPKRPIGSRGEMWIPLWSRPTTLAELQAVFGEGRAHVGSRPARTGTDFARALVTLGVDRGLEAFERLGFQIRNGRSFFATPLGRFVTHRNARANLLAEIDGWLDRLRREAGPRAEQVPSAVSRALRQLETRILELCREGSPKRLQAVLIALGQAERALARSLAWTTGRNEKPPRIKLYPLCGLSPHWLQQADDGSTEFRLAAALASVHGWYKDAEGRPVLLTLRHHLEPVGTRAGSGTGPLTWDDPPSNDVVWHEGDLVQVLIAILARRLIRAQQAGKSDLPDHAHCPAPLPDVIAFLEGRTDDTLLADLLWGLVLLNWQTFPANSQSPGPARDRPGARTSAPPADSPLVTGRESEPGNGLLPEIPPACYSLLRLAYPRPGERKDLPEIPAVSMIHRLAAAGRAVEASRLAVRRLRGSGLRPAFEEVFVPPAAARRIAAALLFPLSPRDLSRLRDLVLKPEPETVL